jgi:polyhydroxybutyrate depolymerase
VALEEVDVDGEGRTYRVFAPPTVDQGPSTALVLALHDAFGDAQSFSEATQLDRAASAGNFVVVYPESVVGTWNAGSCCGRAAAEGVDDMAFLTAVLDELTETYPIDPGRVYAVGASNGGFMAYRMACEAADRVTAVASVGGAMALEGCAPRRPVSILAIHGTEDGHVPYQGGRTSGGPIPVPAQPELLAWWAERNGCGEDADVEADGPATTTSWGGCRAGRSVQLVTIEGGGHTWFSAEFGGAAGAVDATGAITEFLDLAPR